MTPKIKFDPPSQQYEDLLNDMIEQYYSFLAESDRLEQRGYVKIQKA